ncbi:MAG: 50S ribosomal protein L40e [Thermoplasmata archaeon]|nr:MAG: 50S ribosomal protein L40e [Thermoplasmata archaeon]HDJ27603.1 50S ribosomal protein L40e [Aciduliprofundum sp.]
MRFPEAVERRLKKKVCMKCGALNAWNATRCRRCHSRDLRPKHIERRAGR